MSPTWCFVCGVGIKHYYSPPDRNAILSQKEKWEKHGKEPGFLFMKAEELENHDFPRQSGFWHGLYRLIYYKSDESEYCLSGVGYFHSLEGYLAPKNPDQAFIGQPAKKDRRLNKACSGKTFNWLRPLGPDSTGNLPVAVHMSCWKVAQLVLGATIADNLELFAAIALQNAWVAYGLRKCYPSMYLMVTTASCTKIENPYRTCVVKEAIARSKKVKRPCFDRSEMRTSRVFDLPAELLYCQILDPLTCKDLSNWEIAMQIALPESYWRERAAVYLIEMDEIPGKEKAAINWRSLSTELESVDELQVRRRAVDSLRAMKPTYLRNLDKRVFPYLREVMCQIGDQAKQLSLAQRLERSEDGMEAFLNSIGGVIA